MMNLTEADCWPTPAVLAFAAGRQGPRPSNQPLLREVYFTPACKLQHFTAILRLSGGL